MMPCDAGTTNPTLLNRLGDWRDHEAWVDFVTRYDPVIRSASSISTRLARRLVLPRCLKGGRAKYIL